MKHYKVYLSSGEPVTIDEDDLIKIEQNLSTGNLIRLKKGIINPSFVVLIIPTRKEEDIEEENRVTEGYIDEKTGKYILTKDKKDGSALKDEFSKETKAIANKMKIEEINDIEI